MSHFLIEKGSSSLLSLHKLFLLNPFLLSVAFLKELPSHMMWFPSSPRPARKQELLFLKSSQPAKVMLPSPKISACFGDSAFKSASTENMHVNLKTDPDRKNGAVNSVNFPSCYSLLDPVLKLRPQGVFPTKKETL